VTSGHGLLAASGASAVIAQRLDLSGVAFAGFLAALGGAILITIFRGPGPARPFPLAIGALLRTGVCLLAPGHRWPAPVAVP
jgi:hypothetical protein